MKRTLRLHHPHSSCEGFKLKVKFKVLEMTASVTEKDSMCHMCLTVLVLSKLNEINNLLNVVCGNVAACMWNISGSL